MQKQEAMNVLTERYLI